MKNKLRETFRSQPCERCLVSQEKLSIRCGRIGPFSYIAKVSSRFEFFGLKQGPIMELSICQTDGTDLADYMLSWNLRPALSYRREDEFWRIVQTLEEHYRKECVDKQPPRLSILD